jgi:hypothetical protein
MIVGSIVLVLIAAVLLVLGVVQISPTLFYSSIVSSALAAFALFIGVRQSPAGRLPEVDFDVRPAGPGLRRRPPKPVGRAGVPQRSQLEPPLDGAAAQLTEADRAQLAYDDDSVPADEPGIQAVSGDDAAAVARMRAEVVVVDDRPRYHVVDCLHLLGRPGQRLSAREATRLGFTPCAHCEPVTRLLSSR